MELHVDRTAFSFKVSINSRLVLTATEIIGLSTLSMGFYGAFVRCFFKSSRVSFIVIDFIFIGVAHAGCIEE